MFTAARSRFPFASLPARARLLLIVLAIFSISGMAAGAFGPQRHSAVTHPAVDEPFFLSGAVSLFDSVFGVHYKARSGTGTGTMAGVHNGGTHAYALVPEGTEVTVSVATNPAGLSFTVDSVTYDSTQRFNWTVGSDHSISTTSLQSVGSDTRYVWNSWSDGGAQDHNVTITGESAYTANFTTQYLLTMCCNSQWWSVSPASGFFDAGRSVQITGLPGSGFSFWNWMGSGTGSYTGTSNPATVVMNGPISQAGIFEGNPPMATPSPSPTATITPSPTPSPSPTQTPFIEWDFSVSHTASPQPGAIGRTLTYRIMPKHFRFINSGDLCPAVRFKFPTGVPFTFNSAQGANSYAAVPDAGGVTFTGTGPCLPASQGVPAIATFMVVLTPQAAGTLTSLGSDVVIDPGNQIPEDIEGNNTSPFTISTTVLAAQPAARFDYDGDHRSDISVFRPSDNIWYLQRSADGFFGIQFGLSSDKIAPADYDGDGKVDIAVYRPSDGMWYIANSASGTYSAFPWGLSTDLPAPADFDGDGRADVAVYRGSNGFWYIVNSHDGSFTIRKFGLGAVTPIPGEYDGDGRADLAYYSGYWNHLNSSNGLHIFEQFGIPGDKVAPADYDGDNVIDMCMYRPSNSTWYFKKSATGTYSAIAFGLTGDIPAAGDYDGDGKADIAVFRPSNGIWYIANSSNGSYTIFNFGLSGDRPTENAFGN